MSNHQKRMSSRKRAFEDIGSDPPPATKYPRLHSAPLLPSPSLTTSLIHDERSQGRKACKRSSTASPESPSKTVERALQDSDPDCARPSKRRRQSSSSLPRTWFLDDWLRDTRSSPSTAEKLEETGIIPTIEGSSSPRVLLLGSPVASDQMSQQDGETPTSSSLASGRSERLNTSSPLFRGTLKMNGIVVDNSGTKIPREVQELLDKHIRKERLSPRLGEDEETRTIEEMQKVWNNGEAMVSDIVKATLFPLDAPGIQEGRGTPCSTKPIWVATYTSSTISIHTCYPLREFNNPVHVFSDSMLTTS